MSWLRRFLLLAGLVTGAWLLGGSGQANADIRVEIDQLAIEVELPVVDIAVEVETAPPSREQPVPPKSEPRVEAPEVVLPAPPAPEAEAPARAEVARQPYVPPVPAPLTAEPANPVPQQPQSQPQAEQPVPGTLPQSGAGSSTSTQIPAGTLPHAMRPPTTTASEISTERQDVPRAVHVEEPTFSPD
ncbi:hypothetical protein PV646_11695 [Streptomyces sp. ID05-26A]|nr:hypothetical protein [Streptomyces sp. ID05-26A]